MHIPDGFLSPPVFISGWLAAVASLSYALKKTKQTLKDKMVPLMGVMAAFIFASQMLNFPVLGGTSGHLLGGVLASLTLGPYAACVVLTLVLAVQCFIFQDGGLTALGANIFNMSFVGTAGGYFIYLGLKKLRPRHRRGSGLFLVGLAAWSSVVIAAIFYSVELAASGAFPFKILLSSMVLIHAIIGIAEAVITCLVVGFILKVRPDLIYGVGKYKP